MATCAVFLALLKVSPAYAVFVVMWFALGIGMGYLDMLVSSCMADLYEGIIFCIAFTFLCSLFCRFAKLPDKR